MKKLLTLIAILFLSSQISFGQGSQVIINGQIFNSTCGTAYRFCEPILHHYDWNQTGCVVEPLFYEFTFGAPFNNSIVINMSINNSSTYEWFGPFASSNDACTQIQAGATAAQSGPLPQGVDVNVNNLPGVYILKIVTPPTDCSGLLTIGLGGNDPVVLCPPLLCEECITSFSPTPGKYIVSAWVKEASATPTTLSYANVSIVISYPGISGSISLQPKGKIIDGWQRIESEIEIPPTASGIDIQLTVSSGDAFFDDIRFFPFDGSMMSYVYDPLSLRLMAELDERNYATLYEYDEEGKLVRVKKETEKGVLTIQENRDNIKK